MTTKNPFFSIIIPTYNCPHKLNKALDSVEKQTYRNFEVIVSDSSLDNTKQVVDSYSGRMDVKYLWEESRGGPARARNIAVQVAKGDYVVFLDSDDWWYPNKLEYTLRYLDKGDILFHDLAVYTAHGKKLFKKIKGRRLKKPVFLDLMKNTNALFPSSVTVKKSLLEKAGGFTQEDTLEDFDLWLKIARMTDSFYYIPMCLGAYWIGADNRSRASEKMAERIKSVYQKHIDFLSDPEDKREVRLITCYLLGRIKQQMGLPGEAKVFFKKSLNLKNNKFVFRSICWIVLLDVLSVINKCINFYRKN